MKTQHLIICMRIDSEIGQKINIALNSIEEHNSGKLRNVFRAIDFNSPVAFGEKKEKNGILKNLLTDLCILYVRIILKNFMAI